MTRRPRSSVDGSSSEKPFLKRIYVEWYEEIRAALPPDPAPVLEIGSGGAS
jgi:hypothetical protein